MNVLLSSTHIKGLHFGRLHLHAFLRRLGTVEYTGRQRMVDNTAT